MLENHTTVWNFWNQKTSNSAIFLYVLHFMVKYYPNYAVRVLYYKNKAL